MLSYCRRQQLSWEGHSTHVFIPVSSCHQLSDLGEAEHFLCTPLHTIQCFTDGTSHQGAVQVAACFPIHIYSIPWIKQDRFGSTSSWKDPGMADRQNSSAIHAQLPSGHCREQQIQPNPSVQPLTTFPPCSALQVPSLRGTKPPL